MATAPITYDDLIGRFPELSNVDSIVAVEVISEVHERVGDHWPTNLRAQAQLYLAAHILAVEGGTQRSADTATLGPVTAAKEGDLSKQFTPAGGSAAYLDGKNYADTPYGRRFAELERAAFGGSVFAV